MNNRVSDFLQQIRWVLWIAAAAAGLQMFSNLGSAGDLMSGIVRRIVLGYREAFYFLWEKLSDFFGVNLLIYSNKLTISCLVVAPYIFYFRKVSIGHFSRDAWFSPLPILNLFSVIFISSQFPERRDQIFFSEWEFWIFFPAISTVFIFLCIKNIDLYISRFILALCIILISISFGVLIRDFHIISSSYQPVLSFVFSFFYSFSYCLGILFSIKGHYPFLTACIFYFVFLFLDLLENKILPWIDVFLASRGI
ncbi:hypothetical protein [Nitratireductor sp.]|uniref:hypothetical protein n=1 Tax=Nitratireductor sp. TaxID=1872084 RepID=UPI002605B7F8|nr:hypothetical protein [Nitratireductor sp.]MCV0380305.1 hypothetical protein [Nitratireductor sp.]